MAEEASLEPARYWLASAEASVAAANAVTEVIHLPAPGDSPEAGALQPEEEVRVPGDGSVPDAEPADDAELAGADDLAPVFAPGVEAGEPLPVPVPMPVAAPWQPAPVRAGVARRVVGGVARRLAALALLLGVTAAIGYGLAFAVSQLATVQSAGQAATPGAPASNAVPGRSPVVGAATPAAAASGGPAATGAPASPAATGAAGPSAAARVHIVIRGETLASIAARYGVTVAQIVAANGIVNPNLIYAGQQLVIPSP